MTDPLSDTHHNGSLTLREVMDAPNFRGTEVLAGSSGLDRIVASVNIMENPDITPWVKPGELLLTVGYSLQGSGLDVATLIDSLDDRGLAGLGVKLGPYIAEIEPDALAAADRRGFPILALPAAVSFDDLIADVHGARDSLLLGGLYQRRDREQELMSIALEGAGLAELAGRLAALTGEEVLVLGPGNEIIAHHGPDPEPPLPRDPSDSAQFADADGAPIVFGSTYVGHLYVFPTRGPATPSFPGLVPTSAKIMALAASREIAVASVDSQFRAEFLERVLLDRLDRSEIDRRCQALEWKIEFPSVVVSLSPATLDTTPRLERADDRLEWALRAHGLHSPHAIIAGDVVAVVGGSDPERVAVEAADEVIARSVTGNWSAGVSGLVGSPSELEKGWEQARIAARVTRKSKGVGVTGLFARLGVYRLLSEIEADALRDFAAETLGPLLGDGGGKPELRRTLAVLLASNMNVARTARELHYHYNSIRYRVTQLEGLVGPFSTDPTLRLELQVALLICNTMSDGTDPGLCADGAARHPSNSSR